MRNIFMSVAALALALLMTSCAGMPPWIEASPSEDELKSFPLDKELPGEPPESGCRNWGPFKDLGYRDTSYNIVLAKCGPDGRVSYELWSNNSDGFIVVRRGKALDALGEMELVCDSKDIFDVPDKDNPSIPAPKRMFTRFSSVIPYKEKGLLLLACVCPAYLPGSVELFPALVASESGEPGTFKYLGKIKGEPAEMAAKKKIWCDGGSLLRLDDGRYRMYLNGFGPRLSALEADSPEGEWHFLKNPDGSQIDILPSSYPLKGCCFPHVLRVSQNDWRLWITDKWPPQTIWQFQSEDGLNWKPCGRQPEISRKLFNGHGFKCLRAYLAPDGSGVHGVVSVYKMTDTDEHTGWTLFDIGELKPPQDQ